MQEKLFEIIYSKFKAENGIELPTDETTTERVRSTCEKAIIELQQMKEIDINIPFIAASSKGPVHLSFSVTKEFIESYNLSEKDETIQNKTIIFENEQNNKSNMEFKEKNTNSFMEDMNSQEEKTTNKKMVSTVRKRILLFILIVFLVTLGFIVDAYFRFQ